MKIIKVAAKCLMVCACMLKTPGILAQETEYTPLNADFDFMAVKDIKMSTKQVLQYGSLIPWDGGDLRAGVVDLDFQLFNCKEIPKSINLPDNPSCIYTIKDHEGNVAASHVTSLESQFGSLRFLHKFSRKYSVGLLVRSGGKYTVTMEITPGLFSYETELTLVDEPNMQVYDKSATVDSQLGPELLMQSGYPYTLADVSGKKHLHWQLTSADSPSNVIAEKDEVFELKSETPDLAAAASLRLTVANLRPGEYRYTLSSDFAPANYSFIAAVYDVLDPDITLDRESYTIGESNEAVVNLDMSYRYPFVGADSSSDKPTVTVCADLLGEETCVSYSDEAWADSDMHCMAQVKVPLDKVAAEAVTENKGDLPLHLSILFNGTTQYETDIPLHFESDSSGIDGINADNSNKSGVRYFNILGVEVDKTYHGLVITSDGRKLIW